MPSYAPPDYPPQGYHSHPPAQQYPPGPPPPQNGDQRGLGTLALGLGAAALVGQAGNQHANAPPSGAPAAGVARTNTREDPLAVLKRFDTVIIVDDSASMQEGGRWKEAEIALQGVVNKVVLYDADGVDVYFLNSSQHLQHAKSPQDVGRIFNLVHPVGASTPTEVRVEELLGAYVDRLELGKKQGQPPIKPLNVIILTDGQADDPDTLAYALAGFAQRLEEGKFPLTQLGVQFVQVGNDPTATRALQELDDDLKHNHNVKRDIVDMTPYVGHIDGDFIIKVLLGGVNRRVDRG